MRIRDWMTRDPVVVTPETPLMEARKKMNEYKIHHLPVVKKGKLVGLLTRRKILEATPSSATTLSIHELSYLLAKMTVGEIMEKNVVAVSPDTPVEEVVLIGYRKQIGSFPVVENGRLVGIATATEVTRGLLEIFAAFEEGALRLTLLNVSINEETFPAIVAVLKENHARPLSIFTAPGKGTGDRKIVIRCKADKGHRAVIEGLKKAGFIVEKLPPPRKM